ncbi:hypothetical protein Bbelb_300380 [Branchiostoma belcheri]|nr:hypothetical protein Bbelb_300380 [Branchiostoma belcheri]
MASNIPFWYFVFATEEMTLLHGPTICRLKGQHRNEPGNQQEEGLRRPRPAPLHSRPGYRCTPRPARRSGLTAITTDTITTPSRRQTGGSLSFQDENVSLRGGSDFSGAGQRSPGSGKGGPRSGCSGVPRTGTAGPREWEQWVPGTGATGPESGAATHGAVHGHFLPCTGMYRDRVRAYNVQYTTCTQKWFISGSVQDMYGTGHVSCAESVTIVFETFARKPEPSPPLGGPSSRPGKSVWYMYRNLRNADRRCAERREQFAGRSVIKETQFPY